jgi:hypothetical protein
MADLFWDRIEPHTRDPALEEGLQARLADPLWLLARQWQVGEFRGEDAASPIHVHALVEHRRLTGFRNDAVAGAAVEPLVDGRPLESRVEAESIGGRGRVAIAAEAGLQLLRRLDEHGLAHLRAPLRTAFPLDVGTAAERGLPARELRRLALLERGSVDGLRARAAGRDAVLAVAGPDDQAELGAAIDVWLAEQRASVDYPDPSGETWAADRLEYRFSVMAAAAQQVVLSADGYTGGHLDWEAFDVTSEAVAPPAPTTTRDMLPVPVAYAGMPASTHWQLEDGTVSFGDIQAGPTDLARLVVAEFAMVYSDDYFLVPIRLTAGSVARVTRLEVLTTFGERFTVRSAAEWDEAARGSRPWVFFESSGDPGAASGVAPWLVLPPALAASQHGDPLESVTFVRDEEANLVWGIEERVETASGGSVRRRLMAALDAASPTQEADAGAEWRYRLQSSVPPYWVPFVPERAHPGSAQVRLRRARLLAWEGLDDPSSAGPLGRILAPERPLWLYEEEVPVIGAQVTRRWQLARGADGRAHMWLARRTRPGRGERASGLRYDSIDRGL